MAARGNKPSITDIMRDFLATKGRDGATLSEIYVAIRKQLGEQVTDSSIQASLYRRLPTSISPYSPLFERIRKKEQVRYRLLQRD